MVCPRLLYGHFEDVGDFNRLINPGFVHFEGVVIEVAYSFQASCLLALILVRMHRSAKLLMVNKKQAMATKLAMPGNSVRP